MIPPLVVLCFSVPLDQYSFFRLLSNSVDSFLISLSHYSLDMFCSRILRTCIVRLKDCTVKPTLKLESVFTKKIPSFEIYEANDECLPYKYAILGHNKTEFLNLLAMKYIADPPLSRVYPIISETKKYDQIEYLNFKESSGLDKVHLSARYELFSFKGTLEMSDDVNSVRNYITGNNNYNSNQEKLDDGVVDRVIELFNLKHLSGKWINSLSNGQLRRARIAKSILSKPKMLIIDDPFLGLDPVQTDLVSQSLENIVKEFQMAIVLGLRFQDSIPEWIDNVAEVDQLGLKVNGKKDQVLGQIIKDIEDHKESVNAESAILTPIDNNDLDGPYHIEFNNASVVYKELPVLQSFNWKVPQGSNWRILGENGTGKTTILSLITADHPQSWRSVLKINDKLRKSGQGITFFDVNNDIGISSPELHSLAPSRKTMRQIIMNGLVKNIGNSNFEFKGENLLPNDKLQHILQYSLIKQALDKYGDTEFIDLSITMQKLTLFLRAIIKDPKLIILDEAFSCMDDIQLMHQCHEILQKEFQDSTILSIGHIEWELIKSQYVLKLVGDELRSYNVYRVD